ncbi:hypothetical protein [Streptomyces polychromogenes]
MTPPATSEEPIGGWTALMDFDPDGMAENIADKFGFVERQVKGDLKRFKHFIEDRGAPTGQWRGQV